MVVPFALRGWPYLLQSPRGVETCAALLREGEASAVLRAVVQREHEVAATASPCLRRRGEVRVAVAGCLVRERAGRRRLCAGRVARRPRGRSRGEHVEALVAVEGELERQVLARLHRRSGRIFGS